MQGLIDLVDWLYTRQCTCPEMVTHPSTTNMAIVCLYSVLRNK